ncbi:zinc dependent phospholipase C family protein [Paenibacillus polygoni]|uniref:Zinc dependent phospholipase C family protein n=1 Tax=Paenibacillus polygoni TaxID=3050112 RepID=A0ABY8XAV9_9BACL|nr:zinc dependent phospholipase C family protein [Paenibacillus polygoni]WIV21263.1 zinc dependent phospholipase C family protein [Paenibacillus polygoni]
MGSRIMHLVIANRIAQNLSMEDRTLFLLGSIAPDAVSLKDQSHFFIGDVQDFSRSVDYQSFLEKYRSQADSPYIRGYYTHLIADDVWLRGFNLPWLRNRMEADKELFNLYYHDFWLLNGKLLEYYNFTNELSKALSVVPELLDLEEVTSKEVHEFLPCVVDDMNYDTERIKKNLNVFTFTQMIGYIETCVDLGTLHIQRINEVKRFR